MAERNQAGRDSGGWRSARKTSAGVPETHSARGVSCQREGTAICRKLTLLFVTTTEQSTLTDADELSADIATGGVPRASIVWLARAVNVVRPVPCASTCDCGSLRHGDWRLRVTRAQHALYRFNLTKIQGHTHHRHCAEVAQRSGSGRPCRLGANGMTSVPV